MTLKKFNIKYEIVLNEGLKICGKEINIKNCESNIGAQIKLEKYLIKKYTNFKHLIVISCTEDYINGMFGNDFLKGNGMGDFDNIFGDFFGKK